MIVELEHDYVDLKSADFVRKIDVTIDETGIYIWLEVRDYQEPDGEDLYFHVRVPWEPVIEDGAMETIDSVRGGVGRDIDVDELTELRDEWIAMIAQFNRGVRMLTQAINGAKEIEL